MFLSEAILATAEISYQDHTGTKSFNSIIMCNWLQLQITTTKHSSRGTVQFYHHYHKQKAVYTIHYFADASKWEKIKLSGILPPMLFATSALHPIPQRVGPPQS